MLNINIIISFFHIMLGIFMSFYAFIFPKNFLFDFLYILFIIFLLFSWILFDNECVISYYYYKINNIKKNKDTSDIDEIIDSKSFFGKFCFVFTTLAIIISIYIAAIRSKIASSYIITLFIINRFMYLFYNSAVGYSFKGVCCFFIGKQKYNYFFDLYKKYNINNCVNPYFNKIVFGINLYILMWIIYKNKNRLF